MPMASIFILITIIAAFAAFGIVLAWGEYQTRHLVRELRQRREKDGPRAEQTVVRVKFDQTADATKEADLTKAA
jgi:hypothetical protein